VPPSQQLFAIRFLWIAWLLGGADAQVPETERKGTIYNQPYSRLSARLLRRISPCGSCAAQMALILLLLETRTTRRYRLSSATNKNRGGSNGGSYE